MWDLNVAKNVEGRSSGGKAYSSRLQPWSKVQGSVRPSLDSPSLQLLSLSIHSIHVRQPRPWRRTWLNWAIRWTSEGRQLPRINAEAAASLSINHRISCPRRCKGWNQGTMSPHSVSPGKICCFRSCQLSMTDWGTEQVPPKAWACGGKQTHPSRRAPSSKDASL